MAMPSEIATADATDSPAEPCSAPANTTPTAIPSGRLWRVTANASMAVRDKRERGPSGVSEPTWRCGVSSSSANRKKIPNRNPATAGMTLHLPLSASISIAGISSDHTDAATITPEANPSSDFCTRSGILSFMKNTNAEPSMVHSRGMSSPITSVVIVVI